jgi:hypothetical protein
MYVTFKDPDQLGEAISETKDNLQSKLQKELGLSKAGAEAEAEQRMKAFDNLISKYFEWGEYLTVELDSETQSIRVVSKDENIEYL